MSSSMKFVVGALALASSIAQAQPVADPLAALDLSTAESVPTECTADQLSLIYDSCIAHCQASVPADGMVQCKDVNTRFLMVKCATEADKCGKNTQSQVVRQAQTKRINDLCSTATAFPIAEAKLVFASASEVEQSASMKEQAAQLLGARGTNGSMPTSSGLSSTAPAAPAARGGSLYGSEPAVPKTSRDMYPGEPAAPNSNNMYPAEPSISHNGTDMYYSEPMANQTTRRIPQRPNTSGVKDRTSGVTDYTPETTNTQSGRPSVPKSGKKDVSDYTWSQHGSASASANGNGKTYTPTAGSASGVIYGNGQGAGAHVGVNATGAYKPGMAGNSTKPNSAIRIAPIASAVLVMVMTAFLL